MNRSQRTILVIAAAALAVIVDRAASASSMEGGWFGYATNTVAMFPLGMEPGRQFLVRLALLIAWALVSLRLLRDDRPDS